MINIDDIKESILELKEYNNNGQLITPKNNTVSAWWDGVFGSVLKIIRDYKCKFEECEKLKKEIETLQKEQKTLKEKIRNDAFKEFMEMFFEALETLETNPKSH